MAYGTQFLILLSITLSVYLIIDEMILDNYPVQLEMRPTKRADVFDECKLTIYDPFYKDVALTIKWNNPTTGCKKNYLPMTVLENGLLFIRPYTANEISYCRGRYYEYVHPTKSKPSAWFNLTGKMRITGDVVKTECFSPSGALIDQYLHQHIVETNKSTVTVSQPKTKSIRPDIVMIVLDSVASTMERRSLPKTLSFLETKMGGVHFHHLNRVGYNTRPNAYAMLLDWRIYHAQRQAVGAKPLAPTHPNVCSRYIDNESVIFREFEKIGYKTLFADDYGTGSIFSWSCKGFKKQEANHLFRPFLYAYHTEKGLKDYMSPKNCFEIHKAQLQNVENFLNAYKGRSKFALYWANTASHDLPNELYHTDDDYLSFFQRNQKKLENSFLFFMSDHGPRFGSLAKAELWKREKDNPLLHLSLPKFLRNNKRLSQNMEANSQRLITHYDIYATLVDILKFAPQSNFTDFSEGSFNFSSVNNGTSLLRPFPERHQNRNCRNLPIDSSYCLCEYKREQVNNKSIIERLGELVIKEMNQFLVESNVTQLCTTVNLDKIKLVNGFSPIEDTKLYEVFFSVKPSGGEFSVLSRKVDDGSFIREGDFIRLNRYEHQGDCIDSKLASIRPICFCKKQKN